MLRTAALRTIALAAVVHGGALAQTEPPERNWFEWIAIAPVAVAGEATGEEGRYTTLRVDESLRGDVAVGDQLLVDIREMNRSRNRELYRKARRLELETPYVVLPERSGKSQSGQPVYPRRARVSR